jgi:ATP synthase protein I
MNGPVDHGTELTPDTDAEQEAPFKPLTPEEAQAWRAQNPLMSPWRVVAAQAAMGLACTLVVGLLTQRGNAVWSALYGAAVVVVPGGLMARGLAKGAVDPAAAAASFMLWELVKIALAVVMLVAAAKFAPDLSWPALLATLVVCTKMGWLVLLWRRRPVV